MEAGLPKCLLLLLLSIVGLALARPQESKSSASDWSADWTAEASWWNPDIGNSKDSWRAFPPSKDKLQTRWWEKDELEEDLWNPQTPDVHSPPKAQSPPSPKDSIKKEVAKTESTNPEIKSSAWHKQEFCKYDFECRAGRMCKEGVCVCVGKSECFGRNHPVCGNNGVMYTSHCELHRTACVKHIHLRVDRRGTCFKQQLMKKEMEWLQQNKEAQKDKKETIKSDKIYDYSNDLDKGLMQSDQPARQEGRDKPVKQLPHKQEEECTWAEMKAFKDALLMHHCEKFSEPKCSLEVKTDREYLSSLMFSVYDHNYDFVLTPDELDRKEKKGDFPKELFTKCHLRHFVKFADTIDVDGKVSVGEFQAAFNLEADSAETPAPVEVIPTLATAGNGLELKCGIQADDIVWRRHGTQIEDDKHSQQLLIFEDGSLFISKVGVHHIGNYSCLSGQDENKVQVHTLKVQTTPVLTVTPVTQTQPMEMNIEIKCHTEGVPLPKISWERDGEYLLPSTRVNIHHDGALLVVQDVQFDQDAGTYTCVSHNQAGTTEKSVSVSVLKPGEETTSQITEKEEGFFVGFHSKGFSVYDPILCLKRREVHGDFGNFKFIPDSLDGPLRLCYHGEACQWGGAVLVGHKFIYASQPDQNRLVIIEVGKAWNPLQVINTDKRPARLWYVPHLDEVWVLCDIEPSMEDKNTVVVVRDASQDIQHRSVHTQPVGNRFDMMEDLFIAPPNDLHHAFDYAYVSHTAQRGLFKLNLQDMDYVKAIDFSTFGCVPRHVAFVPIGGHVIIECISPIDHHTLQLVMDYLTDTIVSTTSLPGRPLTSPDSRHVVTVDSFTGRVTVASVSDEGVMETTYEVTVSASISDIRFIPASTHHGYDLALTSADDDDVIFMNLVTGKVDKISGSRRANAGNSWHPSPVTRHIVSSDPTSSYLMTPSRSSMAIVDSKFRQVACEFLDTPESGIMVHVPS